MSCRGWLLAAVLLVPGAPLGAQTEFPIGAWFPGMTHGDSTYWAARLDSVKASGFNTIHAMRGPGRIRTAEYNKKWMDLAQARGLKVQLQSWQQPPEWREHSRNYWTRTFEAEDTDRFTHPIGQRVTDGDRFARYAATGADSSGLLLDSRESVYLRRNPPPPPSEPGYGSRFGHHVFRLKTDDARGTGHIATIRVLGRSDGAVTFSVMDSMEVFEDRFRAADTYQDFRLEYDIGHKDDDRGSIPVRYQVYWTGADTLWVDHIRAHDWEIDPDTGKPEESPHAARLFAGEFDSTLTDTLAKYDGMTAPSPWRFALYDEPRWEVFESVAYVDSFIKIQTGKVQTGGTPGISPYNVPESLGAMERYVDTVDPAELLVDFYPIYNTTPLPGRPAYADSLRRRLDWLITGYGHARDVSQGRRENGSVGTRIPLWCLVQTHNWSNLRNPTPEEIRVQVNLALAHGAEGIYYYQYHSHTKINEDGTKGPRVEGLVDSNYVRTPRLTEVDSLNAMLDSLDSTYLAVTSNEVFPGSDPDGFVHGLSDTSDYFVGTFTHTDRSRYLMVVNEQCTGAPRTTTVTLDVDDLSGRDRFYRLLDVYGGTRVTAAAVPGHADRVSFPVTLDPGAGRLYRIEPVTLTVAYGASTYRAQEGSAAVSIGVHLSSPSARSLKIPVRVRAGSGTESGDYTVGGLTQDSLSFARGDSVRSFTITANEDGDADDETVGLEFGTPLPPGVRAGTPASGTVTLVDRVSVPDAPGSLTAQAGDGRVALSWSAADSNGAWVTAYSQRDSAAGSWTKWIAVPGKGAARDTTRTGLTNGRQYTFEVRAKNRVGDSDSSRVSATPARPRIAGADSVRYAENRTDTVASYRVTPPGDAVPAQGPGMGDVVVDLVEPLRDRLLLVGAGAAPDGNRRVEAEGQAVAKPAGPQVRGFVASARRALQRLVVERLPDVVEDLEGRARAAARCRPPARTGA